MVMLGFLVASCGSSSDHQAQSQAFATELRVQREELNRMRSELDADRQRLYRSIAKIQSRMEDLDRTLKMASAEIWGDGSSTGARLSTAQHTLASLHAEVDALASVLRPDGRRK